MQAWCRLTLSKPSCRLFDKLRANLELSAPEAHLEMSAPGGQAQTALRCDVLAGGDPGRLAGVSANHEDR
jgi:hypothetical protein